MNIKQISIIPLGFSVLTCNLPVFAGGTPQITSPPMLLVETDTKNDPRVPVNEAYRQESPLEPPARDKLFSRAFVELLKI